MAFYSQDKIQSDGDEYKLILDDVDSIVDKFINKLNFYSETADDIRLQSIRQEPFIKVMADVLTGWFLDMEILANNDFNYCEIEC